jgi:hypothetical protein
MLLELVNVPLVLVNAQPEIVNGPETVIEALPPEKVPPLRVAPVVPIVTV